MPRNYKSRGIRGNWNLHQMQLTVNDVIQNGQSYKRAARIHCVPRQTLARHLKEARAGLGVRKALGRPRTLTDDEEEELVSLILDMENRMFGLTLMDVRRMAYQYCEVNHTRHPFNKQSACDGED